MCIRDRGKGADACFVYENEVQKWLDLIRGAYLETSVDDLKLGAKKPAMPYACLLYTSQTAEDGLGDTVKPRLMEADADLERVLVIDDRDTPLTLSLIHISQGGVEPSAPCLGVWLTM